MNARLPCEVCRELPATMVVGSMAVCDLCARSASEEFSEGEAEA
ncbi:MAG: hypothetical protein QXT68_07330 [Halobacteria archaeon]